MVRRPTRPPLARNAATAVPEDRCPCRRGPSRSPAILPRFGITAGQGCAVVVQTGPSRAYNPADVGRERVTCSPATPPERGAARAAAREGVAVVVVDAYRASTTIAVLVSKGARVVPVASIEEAARYPGADYRIGERGSDKVKGFDFGNSPTEVREAHIPSGTTVVLSSTKGTRI